MTFGDTVNENVQESQIHKAVWQNCLIASGHASTSELFTDHGFRYVCISEVGDSSVLSAVYKTVHPWSCIYHCIEGQNTTCTNISNTNLAYILTFLYELFKYLLHQN